MRHSLLVLVPFLFWLASCSQAPVRPTPTLKINPWVQGKLDQSREALAKGNARLALSSLGELQDENLQPIEKAMKYNLKGVVLFSQTEWDKALLNFAVAHKYVPEQSTLEAQVGLNIASVHYKQGLYAELKQDLDNLNIKVLPEPEIRKYAQLKLAWAMKFQRHYEIVETSVLLMKEAKTLAEVHDSILKEKMALSFKAMDDGDKMKLLEEFRGEKWLPLAYLGQLEAESRYFNGDLSGARDVADWLDDRFSSNPQVKVFVTDFKRRLDASSRISLKDIGVVLPLTGEKGGYGQKILLGIESAFKEAGFKDPIQVHTKDDLDSPTIGAKSIQELVQDHKVALIIGGLFPESARAEYLEAKRWGVLYLSLAPVHLPREEKNHQLVEIQGSVESQVAALVTDEMLARFGKRVGVIYPQGETGKVYADEFWRASVARGMQLTAIAPYPKGTLDFRDTIQHFLGLQFPREREEEVEIFQNTYALEKSSIRRIQTLPPALDFDWVFVASYPYEALSLVPTFGYYDARDITVFGGPSWASRSFLKEQKNLGKIFLVGEDPADMDTSFSKKFQETYGTAPTLMETLGHDAGMITAQLLKDNSVSDRSDFDAVLKKQAALTGLASQWKLSDGLWLKNMQPLAVRNGEIRKIFESDKTSSGNESTL